MLTMDVRLLTEILNYIEQAMFTGFGLIQADGQSLMKVLVSINITTMVIAFCIRPRAFRYEQPVKKLFGWLLVAYIMEHFQYISQVWLQMMSGFGLHIGGDRVGVDSIREVGKIVAGGWAMSGQLLKTIDMLSGFPEIFIYPAQLLFYILCWLIMIAAFVALGGRIFVLLVEYFVLAPIAYLVTPFAIWNRTAFMAEKTYGYLASNGIAVMLLMLMYGLMHQYMLGFQLEPNTNMWSAFEILIVSLISLFMVWKAPKTLHSLTYGSPNMQFGDAVRAVAGPVMSMLGAVGAVAPHRHRYPAITPANSTSLHQRQAGAKPASTQLAAALVAYRTRGLPKP